MIVQIRDGAALSSIPVSSLRSYLDSRGWDDTGKWGKRPIAVFAKERGGRTWEILVPYIESIGGYASNMADALAVLADVEDRSQLDVFQDLMGAGADVIRARSLNGPRDKPLSLRRMSELYRDAYAMVESAARAAATDKPQANYRGPLKEDVRDYLDSVHPLPDYRGGGGSLALRSPVPKRFETREGLGCDSGAPFPRRAALKLAQALASARAAMDEAVASDDPAPFREAVAHGVSSNLCESVANLARNCGGIEIGLSWALDRPAPPSAAANPLFAFSEHSADMLSEAARALREGVGYEFRNPRYLSIPDDSA